METTMRGNNNERQQRKIVQIVVGNGSHELISVDEMTSTRDFLFRYCVFIFFFIKYNN